MEVQQHRTANAQRVAKAYQRAKAGRAVLAVEVDAVALAVKLIDMRLLDPAQVDDREVLVRATTRLLEIILKERRNVD